MHSGAADLRAFPESFKLYMTNSLVAKVWMLQRVDEYWFHQPFRSIHPLPSNNFSLDSFDVIDTVSPHFAPSIGIARCQIRFLDNGC